MAALHDKFGRAITDLRISITDRCNYKCVYCRTGNEGALYGDLPFEDYLRMARVLVGMGSVVLDGAVVGDDSFVAAGSLVTCSSAIPPLSATTAQAGHAEGAEPRNASTWLAAARAVATQAGMPTPS